MIEDLRSFERLLVRASADLGRALQSVQGRLLVLALAATTLLAYAGKWQLQACVERGGGGGARAIAGAVDAWGDGATLIVLGLATLLAGRLAHRRVLVDAALVLGVAGLWCWLLTEGGQLVLAERRPKDGGAMLLFALGGHGVSGHASGAGLVFFPVRDVLARNARPIVRGAVTAALVAWAALVGWSRVWLGMHFVWNVVLGLAIGLFTGLVASRAQGALARS